MNLLITSSSLSCTVVKCPSKYTVYKSENFMDKIVKGFKFTRDGKELEEEECGDDLADFEDSDDVYCNGYNGQILVNSANVVLISKTKESNYPSSFFVVEKASDSDLHTVYRYFVDADGALAFKLIFKTSSYSEINELYLFDDQALAVVNGNSLLKMIHYKDFTGDVVPENYGITLHRKGTITDSAIAKSVDGQYWELYLSIKSSAAQLVNRYKIVDFDSYNSRLEQNSSSIALLHSVVLSYKKATSDLIILGCKTCQGGYGWIKLYDRQTFKSIKTIKGSSKDGRVGSSIALVSEAKGLTHLWYSINKGGVLYL